MDGISEYKVGPLTLSLRTEVLRKRKEFETAKTHKEFSINKTNTPLFKKDKQKKNIDSNKHKKKRTNKLYDPETEELLAKSKKALEKKSRIYDEMNREENLDSVVRNSDSFLVDFEQKIEENKFTGKFTQPPPPPPPPTDYLTNFGELGGSNLFKGFIPEGQVSDTKRENSASENLHYQEAIGNEIREHGVGYFSFSTDENVRKEQMEDLNRLHTETQNSITKRAKVLAKRKADKAARMRAIRAHMRKELTAQGRDVSFLDEADEIAEKEAAVEANSVSMETQENETIDKRKEEVFKLIDSIRESTREPTIREWDKDKLVATTGKYYSRKETERNPDFAPPDLYSRNK